MNQRSNLRARWIHRKNTTPRTFPRKLSPRYSWGPESSEKAQSCVRRMGHWTCQCGHSPGFKIVLMLGRPHRTHLSWTNDPNLGSGEPEGQQHCTHGHVRNHATQDWFSPPKRVYRRSSAKKTKHTASALYLQSEDYSIYLWKHRYYSNRMNFC